MVSDINQKLATIILEKPNISQVIVHAGLNDIWREPSELLKRDYTDLLDRLDKLHIMSFISGPIPAVDRGINWFSRLLAQNTWLSRVCNLYLFRADDLHPNRLGSKLLRGNLLFSLSQTSTMPWTANVGHKSFYHFGHILSKVAICA